MRMLPCIAITRALQNSHHARRPRGALSHDQLGEGYLEAGAAFGGVVSAQGAALHGDEGLREREADAEALDRKSTRLNSSHMA